MGGGIFLIQTDGKLVELTWLEKAYEDRTFFMSNLKIEPELDPFRSEPRFRELLSRMNFPPQTGDTPL